jgi:hypothetical protein
MLKVQGMCGHGHVPPIMAIKQRPGPTHKPTLLIKSQCLTIHTILRGFQYAHWLAHATFVYLFHFCVDRRLEVH